LLTKWKENNLSIFIQFLNFFKFRFNFHHATTDKFYLKQWQIQSLCYYGSIKTIRSTGHSQICQMSQRWIFPQERMTPLTHINRSRQSLITAIIRSGLEASTLCYYMRLQSQQKLQCTLAFSSMLYNMFTLRKIKLLIRYQFTVSNCESYHIKFEILAVLLCGQLLFFNVQKPFPWIECFIEESVSFRLNWNEKNVKILIDY